MTLKHDGMNFVLCPKQGNTVESGVLNRVGILGFFFVSQKGSGSLNGSPIPKYWLGTTGLWSPCHTGYNY